MTPGTPNENASHSVGMRTRMLSPGWDANSSVSSAARMRTSATATTMSEPRGNRCHGGKNATTDTTSVMPAKARIFGSSLATFDPNEIRTRMRIPPSIAPWA